MGAPSKRARKIRTASEFDLARLRASISPPKEAVGAYAWELRDIVAARNAQMRGDFRLPARLAESFRTDDATSVAFRNRLAPQKCIKVELCPVKGTQGAKIANEAEGQFGQKGVAITPAALADIHGYLVNHEIAFAYNVATPRADGSRVDFEVHPWPIEHVRWDGYDRCFKTRVDSSSMQPNEAGFGGEVPIVHGDGRWIIFSNHEIEPFKHGALLAAALVWARHAFALRDWSKSSLAHGLAKVIGELPEGVPLQSEGGLSAEAAAFQELLIALANSDLPIGIRPAGSETEFISNNSTAWQIFTNLVENAERAAARIYLGTDGTLGAQGGAPGVDISQLFGVASTLVQGDLDCIERCLGTGSIEPWTAINFGDSTLAPTRKYLIADPDADAARASLATRTDAFFAEIEKTRSNGFAMSQEYVDAVAKKHDIAAPQLPIESNKAPSIALAPTDIARVVTVNEARASAGVGPLLLPDGTTDPDGKLTVEQFAAKKASEARPQVTVSERT